MKAIIDVLLFFTLIVVSFPSLAQRDLQQIAVFHDRSEESNSARQHDGTFRRNVDFRDDLNVGIQFAKGFNPVGSGLKELTLYDSLQRPVTRLRFHESGWTTTREWYNYHNYYYYKLAVDKIVRQQVMDTTESGTLYYRLDITTFYKDGAILKVDSIENSPYGICATHPYKTSFLSKSYKSGAYLNAQNTFYMEQYYKEKVEGDETKFRSQEYYLEDSLSTDYPALDLFLERQIEYIHLVSEDSCRAKPKLSTYLPYGDFQEPTMDHAYLPHVSDVSRRSTAPKNVLYDFDWNENEQIALIYGTFRTIKGIPCPEPVATSEAIEEEDLPEGLGNPDCYEIVSSKRRLAYTIAYLFFE